MAPLKSMPVIAISGETQNLLRLQGESELPRAWFDDDIPRANEEPRIRPSLVMLAMDRMNAVGSRVPDSIDLTQHFIRLAGRLVVELLVINSDADQALEAERFTRLVQQMQQYMLERDLRVRFVVIVIDEGAGDATQVLERVNQLCDSPLIDAVFVMTEILEPRERFAPAARDVWPIAVGRLLLHLMHSPPPKCVGRSPMYAWRMMILPPQADRALEQSLQQLSRSLMESIHERVFKQPVPPKSPIDCEVDTSTRALRSHVPLAAQSETYWTEMDVPTSFRKRLDDKRWQAVAANLASQIVKEHAAANQAFLERLVQYRRSQWQAVHENPSFLRRLALRKDVTPDPSNEDDPLGESETGATRKMFVNQQKRDLAIVDAATCATEFELAQQGRVGTLYRLWPCIAVTMAVGYPVLWITYGIFGSIMTPVLCGIATIAATVLAAWYSAESENRAGARARQDLVELLDSADREIERYYLAAAQRMRGSTRVYAKLRAEHLDTHLRELALHGQSVISVIHHDQLATKMTSGGSASGSSTHAAAQGGSDALFYREQLSLPLPFHLTMPAEGMTTLKPLVEAQADRFLVQVWAAAMGRFDKLLAGNIAYEALVSEWEQFQATLGPLLVTFICRQQFENATSETMLEWGNELSRLQQLESELGLLSCHIPSRATNHQRIHPAAQLVLQNGFETIAATPSLPHTELVHIDSELEILELLPWLGYWFQAIEVTMVVMDGRLAVDPNTSLTQSAAVPNGS